MNDTMFKERVLRAGERGDGDEEVYGDFCAGSRGAGGVYTEETENVDMVTSFVALQITVTNSVFRSSLH